MPGSSVVVIGGSAGGIEASCDILSALPDNLSASIFIVQHVGASSDLAQVLDRCGEMQVQVAEDGSSIKQGRAYVAPGNKHLLLADGHIKLTHDARENGHRPSVDALFRSASRVYRSQVIAVVLSGALYDGAAGAYAVKQRGGVLIVQDPESARFPSMPRSALNTVQPDYCVPVSEIAPLLVKLLNKKGSMRNGKRRGNGAPKRRGAGTQHGSIAIVCPECNGPMKEDLDGPPGQTRCVVGHAFGPEALSEMHRDALERTLLTAIRMLRERAVVRQQLSAGKQHHRASAAALQKLAETETQDEKLLREILERI